MTAPGAGAPVVALGLLAAMLVDGAVLVGVFIPGDLVVVAATALAGWPGAVLTAAAGLTGLVAAHVGSFLLGRRTASRLRGSRVGRRIGFARWCRAEQLLHAGGDRALLATPFLPVVNTILPVLAGSLGVRPRRFVMLIVIADVFWIGLWTSAASSAELIPGGTLGALLVPLVVSVPAAAVFGLVLRRAHITCGPAPSTPRSVIVEPPD